MNDRLIFRDARVEELDKISELIRRSFWQYQRQFPQDAWKVYLESITDIRSRLDKSQLIVSEVGTKLAGTVTLYMNAKDSDESWPEGWAAIRLLAVDPQCRRLGIAKALIEECLQRCRKWGIATVGLHTSEIMSVAVQMYENMGFVRAPEFDFHPRPGVIVMAYRLNLGEGKKPANLETGT